MTVFVVLNHDIVQFFVSRNEIYLFVSVGDYFL